MQLVDTTTDFTSKQYFPTGITNKFSAHCYQPLRRFHLLVLSTTRIIEVDFGK